MLTAGAEPCVGAWPHGCWDAAGVASTPPAAQIQKDSQGNAGQHRMQAWPQQQCPQQDKDALPYMYKVHADDHQQCHSAHGSKERTNAQDQTTHRYLRAEGCAMVGGTLCTVKLLAGSRLAGRGSALPCGCRLRRGL